MNIEIKNQLPPELCNSYLSIADNILCYQSNFIFTDLGQKLIQRDLTLITPLQLPIDGSFYEDYIFRYKATVDRLNQVRFLSKTQHHNLCLFNIYVLADLYLDLKPSLDLKRYGQDLQIETFLLAPMEKDDQNQIDWKSINDYVDLKTNQNYDKLTYATALDADKLQGKIAITKKNTSLLYVCNELYLNLSQISAIEYFKTLIKQSSFSTLDDALGYLGLNQDSIIGVSLLDLFIKFEFDPNFKNHLQNIFTLRAHLNISEEAELVSGIVQVSFIKHFKHAHGAQVQDLTKDCSKIKLFQIFIQIKFKCNLDCEKCSNTQTQCSIIKSNPLKNPNLIPISQLYIYPLQSEYLDFINQVSTTFINRLVEWIRAGQLKTTLQINSKLPFIRQSLCTPAISPINNYEVLEVLGDSAMKYITSLFIYIYYNDTSQEDFMTMCRTNFIKNSYLTQIATSQQIFNYVNFRILLYQKKQQQKNQISAKNYYLKYMDYYFQKNYNPTVDQIIIVESQLADVFEALLGSIFQSTWDFWEVTKFMKASNFAFTEKPQIDKIIFESLLRTSKLNQLYEENFFILQNEDRVNVYPMAQYIELNNLNFKMEEANIDYFQKVILQYQFKNINLLIEALTFASDKKGSNEQKIKFQIQIEYKDQKNYQNLEFFGDAAIETFVITNVYNQLYLKYHTEEYFMRIRKQEIDSDHYICPGMLHQTKTVLLDNGFMATMALLHGYHNQVQNLPAHYKTILPDLIVKLSQIDKEDYLNIKQLNNTLPKFLGDLWESVAAAIIIDGGWQSFFDVYGRMYKSFIRFVCQNIELIYGHFQKLNYDIQLNFNQQKQNNTKNS